MINKGSAGSIVLAGLFHVIGVGVVCIFWYIDKGLGHGFGSFIGMLYSLIITVTLSRMVSGSRREGPAEYFQDSKPGVLLSLLVLMVYVIIWEINGAPLPW